MKKFCLYNSLFFIFSFIVLSFFNKPIFNHYNTSTPFWVSLWIIITFLQTFAEELFFRFIPLVIIRKNRINNYDMNEYQLNDYFIGLLFALFFSLAHTGFEFKCDIIFFLNLLAYFTGGAALFFVDYKFNSNIPGWILHILNNLMCLFAFSQNGDMALFKITDNKVLNAISTILLWGSQIVFTKVYFKRNFQY